MDLLSIRRSIDPDPGSFEMYASSGASFTGPVTWLDQGPGFPPDSRVVGDFDSDGRDDIGLVFGLSGGGLRVRRSTGLAFGASETWFDQPLDRVRVWIAGDFDGDGDDDVAAGAGAGDSHPGGLEVYVSSGDDFAQETWSHVGPPSFSGWVVGDFDGDGLDDVSAPGPLGLPVFLSTGTEFLPPATWSTTFGPGSPSPSSGDFDGDGLDDIIGVQDTGSLVVYLSTGSAFAGGVSWGEAELTSQDFTYAGDVDGDGLADLLALHRADDSSPGRFDVYLSTGSSFSDAAVWLSHGPVLDELVSVGDFTGR